MQPRLIRLFVLTVFLFASPLALSAQTPNLDAKIREIDEYAQKALKDWNVPGMAIAVVKDDKVLLAKGYGVRKLGESAPVDDKTLFAIASNSKAFTSTALGILVDEGKIKWDDPVTKHLPYFQLFDPYATREMTVRDLLCHRSGLATFGGDLLWYETTHDRDEIIRRIRYLKPVSSFRSRYGYQNIMFIAAGQVVPAVTGKSWDDFLRERIFNPLGMTHTTTTVRDFKPGDNVATPHNEPEGGALRPLKIGNVDNAGGAVGVNSCASDLAEWLRLQLGRGKHGDRRVFSESVSRDLWTPHTIQTIGASEERLVPSQHFKTYGLGFALNDYLGRKVVSHGGALDGMLSKLGMIPEENLGVVVLTNSEAPLYQVMVNKVYDVFLDAPKRDWSAEYLERTKKAKEAQAAEAKKIEDARVSNTKPSLDLKGYVGTYGGEMYGDAKVTEENGKLVVRLVAAPNFVGDLEHWQFDTFRIAWRDQIVYPFPKGFVTFVLNAQGLPEEMRIDVPNPDFDFKELEFKRLRK